jgi:hypothetical protein
MTNDTPNVHLAVWHDPLAAHGLRSDSDDALIYLPPFLGPTSTLVLHRLSRCLTTGTRVVWSIDELAATFGVGASQMRSTLARLERFGMIRTVGERCEVRTRIPALAARHVERMPAYLAAICPYQVAHSDGHAA